MLKLSHWSASKLPKPTIEWFGRFEELSNLDLTKAYVYDGSHWLPGGVTAMTLSVPLLSWLFGSSRIYFNARRSIYDPYKVQGIELLAEELYHAKQQLEQGAARFYVVYLWEYCRHRQLGLAHNAAYNAISFEQEAKALRPEGRDVCSLRARGCLAGTLQTISAKL